MCLPVDARTAFRIPTATAIITPTESTYDIPPEDIGGSGAPLTYGIEATEYPGWPDETFDGLVTISLSILNAGGAVECEDRVQARVAPWLMPSHLDTVDTVYVTNTFLGRGLGAPGGPAPAFPVRLSTALAPTGIAPTVIPSFDPWPQDQYEIGYDSAPGYGWSSVLLNSPRVVPGGELQTYAETDILGSNFGLYGVSLNGTPWTAVAGTYDSFGNLEAFPALGSWTSGLEYHGHRDIGAPPHPGQPRNGMQTDLAMFLERQDVQGRPPQEFSTAWLVVGHVDEFMSVQATGPGTIRIILASPQMAIDLLTADPDHVFTDELWNRLHPVDYAPMTSTDLLDDFGVLNGDLQTQINAQRTAMIALGITDFVEVPVYFAGEDIDADPEWDIGVAAIPDMVNLLNVNGTLIVPDPFYDPFKTAFVANVGVTPQWIDCLEYHWLNGEVHCATNVRRAPATAVQAWWNVTP